MVKRWCGFRAEDSQEYQHLLFLLAFTRGFLQDRFNFFKLMSPE